MDIRTQLYSLYPGLEEEYANNERLFIIRDDVNGDGPYIDAWNHPTLEKPTQAQIPVYHSYRIAKERLSKYILSEGRPEITEEIVINQEPVLDDEGIPTFDEEGIQIMTDITETVITQTAIDPLEEFIEVSEFDPDTMESVTSQIRNPEIVRDEEERAEAQAVVDATPQTVIDAVESNN